VFRRHVLNGPGGGLKKIVSQRLAQWQGRYTPHE
jgi:hypothetical protein